MSISKQGVKPTVLKLPRQQYSPQPPKPKVFVSPPKQCYSGSGYSAQKVPVAQVDKTLAIRSDLSHDVEEFSAAIVANPNPGPHIVQWERLVENVARASFGQVTSNLTDDLVREVMDRIQEEMRAWEEQLTTIGDDAQLANIDLQNMLQKQQQLVQMLSSIAKILHDTATAVIRNIR